MRLSELLKSLLKGEVKTRSDGVIPTTPASRAVQSTGSQATTSHQLFESRRIRSQPDSLFLSLPGELRNKIYAYAAYPSLSTILIQAQRDPVLTFPIFAHPIFHICRQIRFEATSLLCSSKSFRITGLVTANRFFAFVQEHMALLKRVTIRDYSLWKDGSEAVAVEKSELLDHLELAAGLVKLVLVIGQCPLNKDDKAQLQDARSEGAKYVFGVRDVVNGEMNMLHRERVARETFLELCQQMDVNEATRVTKEKLEAEHKMREKKILKVRGTTVWGMGIKKLDLPMWSPDFL